MYKTIFAALGLLFTLGSMAGCGTTGRTDGRESSITTYGTVDAGVSVTRDR